MKNRILLLIVTCLVISCKKNSINTSYKTKTKNELNLLMKDYAEMLQNREMERIADLYWNGDIIMSGNGRNRIIKFDTLKAQYLNQSRTPINCKWEDIRIDPLGEDKAMITSILYWNNKNQPDTLKFSYTGIFIKTDKGWKIKHEHESYKCK